MNSLLGMAVYDNEDYKEILNISDDKPVMNETWETWKRKKEEAVSNYRKMGINVVDVLVKPKELVDYCGEKGLNINGKSRAQYVSYKLDSNYR